MPEPTNTRRLTYSLAQTEEGHCITMARTFTPVNAMTKVKDSQTGQVNKSH